MDTALHAIQELTDIELSQCRKRLSRLNQIKLLKSLLSLELLNTLMKTECRLPATVQCSYTEHCYTLYSCEFECSSVERLNPLGLHCDVGFLQAVFLQQVVHLQEVLPKVLGQKLDLRQSRRRQGT